MGYAAILLAGIWAATATMEVRYRAQVPYDAPLPLVAGLRDARGRRVRAWARLLALTAATGEPWQAVTLGRGMRQGISIASLGPIEPEQACALLDDLAALMREGLCEPLPLPTVAGHAYAKTRLGGASAQEALDEAMRCWSGGKVPENADAAHVRVWGDRVGPSVISGAPGPAGGEPTRFGALAMRLWAPLIMVEDMIRR
jgi:exodeoxyribonuclease V gamma subunit